MRDEVICFLEKEVKVGSIPGAVISVRQGNKRLMTAAVGEAAVYPDKEKMDLNSVFDLASLTKVVCTLPLILKFVSSGEIHLHERICFFLEEFATEDKKEITVHQLLTHTSGLPASRDFYKESTEPKEILNLIAATPLQATPGRKVIYSDLGFIVLYKLIEKLAAQQLNVFAKRELFEPLGMNETDFNPNYDLNRFASTEFDEASGSWLRGVVHDENARFMGGISGHAGLFSTISDLENYVTALSNDGLFKQREIMAAPTLKLAAKNHTPFAAEARGLGWMLKSPNPSSCGDLFSASSYGHTGFTGTSIWIDPIDEIQVILLTNRVHFGRGTGILRLRPRLHNLIKSHMRSFL